MTQYIYRSKTNYGYQNSERADLIIARSELVSAVPRFVELLGEVATHNRSLFVITLGGELDLPDETLEPAESLDPLSSFGEVHVHVATRGLEDDPGLPPSLLLRLADANIVESSVFDVDGRTADYRRAASGDKRALFLFPGTIFPQNLGSHRRAVGLMIALLSENIDLTIAYTGSSFRARVAVLPALRLFGTEAVSWSNRRSRTAKAQIQIRRGLYSLARKILWTKGKAAPETFIERCRLRDNPSLRKLLIRELPKADLALIGYAWMLPAVHSLKQKLRAKAKIVCDTHDVQHLRSQPARRALDSLFFSDKRNKDYEVDLLQRCHRVLAISHRDAEAYMADLPASKVITATSGFSYVDLSPKKRLVTSAPVFGFIGVKMDANFLAIEHILKEWWPVLRRLFPSSKLLIAGSICSDNRLDRILFLDNTVERLGFVDSLVGFYRSIDILLSPALMAGGLNFKSGEAINAGVALVTNPLGAAALAPLQLEYVVDQLEDLLSFAEKYEDVESDHQSRLRLKLELNVHFGTRLNKNELLAD